MKRLIMGLAMVISLWASAEARAEAAGMREKVMAELQIKDTQAVNDIFRFLELAVWRQYGIALSDEETEAVRNLIKEAQAGGQVTADDLEAIEARSEKRRAAEEALLAELKAKGLDKLEPLDWLEKAAARLLGSQPDLSLYETRRRIIRAMHSAWPSSSGLHFIYLKQMTPIEGAPPPPPPDPKYRPWLDAPSDPFYTSEYNELVRLPAEEMPDGAMVPLFSLMRFGAQGLAREGMHEYIPLNVLKKYGPRLYPALADYLVHPDRYGQESSSSGPLKVAQSWPDDLKMKLWRAALMSGWNDIGRYLPAQGEWIRKLLKEFEDSPYGKPKSTGW